ncbi:hypothetical protein WOLCODRAFT_162398 [Wolfiporia cocos MD-104 SS10]|uniref:F-box domain-containing protein n=1 Tax=Wolfiporia cocos (strain MD-104) TaxID=742152 RepID=A0A2H3JNX3_WOLCO|nr:hypothetical protein WOLCODRAFT_162398 [Wolfiporia cocos MD-104 SS10]
MTEGKLDLHVQKADTKDGRRRSTTARGRRKTAPAKRMRKSKPCFLPQMPLDILHLIFGFLGPRELLSLARTNRGFRQTLLADNARPIWKSARMRWPGGSPDCPPDFPEARWAYLLFGDTKCDMRRCRSKDVPINFKLRRRVCEACMTKHLIVDRVFEKTFPDYDKSILELIPSGNAGCRSRFWERKKCQYYWDGDIHNMSKQVDTYLEDIRLRKAEAEDAFLSFKSARIAHVEYVIEHARVCLEWQEEQERLRQAEASLRNEQAILRIQARRYKIFNRFEELGYERRDIDYLGGDMLRVDAELTEDDWHEARATLEPMIIFWRTKRLERVRNELLERRRHVIAKVCTAFKKTLPPLQWPTFPPLCELYELEGFSVLINDPSSDKLEPHRCAHVLEALPFFIAARRDDIRNMLLEKLPAKLVGQTSSACTDAISDPLSLATATFQPSAPSWARDSSLILYTLSDVLAYLSDPSRWEYLLGHPRIAQDMSFSEAGNDAVVSLLTVLSLDARTTTPGELDKLDARFVCVRCPANVNELGSKYQYAMNWHQCVLHHILYKRTANHATPKWMLLDAHNTRLVKMQNSALSDLDLGCDWSCARCSCHFEKTAHRPAVVAHVQQTHGVPEPEEGVDFFNAKPHKHQFHDPAIFTMNLQAESS